MRLDSRSASLRSSQDSMPLTGDWSRSRRPSGAGSSSSTGPEWSPDYTGPLKSPLKSYKIIMKRVMKSS